MKLNKGPSTNKDFIIGLIPQRPPIVMVDKLISFSQKEIVAGFTVTQENIFTQNNSLSAPGLIENMAQTIALHTGYDFFLQKKAAPTGYIGSIKKAQIIALPKIGTELITKATILHNIMGVTLVTATITGNNDLLANAEIKTVLAP